MTDEASRLVNDLMRTVALSERSNEYADVSVPLRALTEYIEALERTQEAVDSADPLE